MEVHSIDKSLYCYGIPIELRRLVLQFFELELLNNGNIKTAVNLWCSGDEAEKTVGYCRYGHISYWDTSKVTDMSSLFYRLAENSKEYREGIESFNEPLDGWDTSNVTDMYKMFECYMKYFL